MSVDIEVDVNFFTRTEIAIILLLPRMICLALLLPICAEEYGLKHVRYFWGLALPQMKMLSFPRTDEPNELVLQRSMCLCYRQISGID